MAAGQVYQGTIVDPTDPHTKGKVYQVNIVGGSASGDFMKQYKEMPEATSADVGDIVEYVGPTVTSYTNGYVYKGVDNSEYSATLVFTPAKIAVSGADFITSMKAKNPATFMKVVGGTWTYYTAADLWALDCVDENGDVVLHYQQYTDDWEDEGFTFTGEFEDEEEVTFTAEISTEEEVIAWTRINVQPAGAGAGTEWGDITGTLSAQTDLNTALNGKQAKTSTATITTGSTTTMASNTVYSGTSIADVTLAYPATVPADFVAEVNLATTTGTITFAIDAGCVMKGNDCSDGTFTPAASSSYTIMFGVTNSTKYGIVVKIA